MLFRQWIKSKMFADIFALVSFAFVVGMFVEVVISGMTMFQSLQSRSMAIPLNMLVARPYGVFRDWMFSGLGVHKSRWLSKTAVDMLALTVFMVPQYVTVLLIVGAETAQIVSASISLVLMTMIIGRPYGFYLDFCRKWFGFVKPSLY